MSQNLTKVAGRWLGSYWVRVPLVFFAYLIAGKIGLSTPFTSDNISPVWPASGVALVAVLLCGYRIWPAIAAAALAVNWKTLPYAAAAGLACGNTLAALAAVFLLRRVARFHTSLSRLRDVLGLIAYAALGSTMVSASIGVAVLLALRVHPWSGAPSAWLIYWLGDAMGVLLVAPLFLSFPKLLTIEEPFHIAELGMILILLIIACFTLFGNQSLLPVNSDVLAFAVFPFVLWAAIRFGVGGCALSMLTISAIATADTALGFGPFARNTPLTNAILLQSFFAALSLSGLTLAAVITERTDLETERERLIREQVLREARLRLAAIVESSADAIISKDMEGKITHWNKGAEQLYGYSSQEVIGQSIAILMPLGRTDEFPEIMHRVEQSERIEHYETIRRRKDGSLVDVSLSISPILNAAGIVVGAAVIARDMSVRKQTEKALRNAEKLSATGQLAAAIAHEINNPLESLTNLLYLVQQSKSLDRATERYVLLAQGEVQRAAYITKQMLAFYRPSSKPALLKLCDVLDAVVEVYDPVTRSQSISIVKRYESEIEISAFPDEIHQVFANLIRNAIEAMAKGGTLTVHVFASHEWIDGERSGVRVVLADTGPGISPTNSARIFEPFFTTKGEKGTGLGLWISRGIILKHGGSVRVWSSARLGRSGTVFNVFLPAEGTHPEKYSVARQGGAA